MTNQKSPTLSLLAAYDFGSRQGLRAEMQAIRDMSIDWDASYTSSVRRGYVLRVFRESRLLDFFKAEHWRGASTPRGRRNEARYDRLRDRYEDFLDGGGKRRVTGTASRTKASGATRRRGRAAIRKNERVPATFEEYLREAIVFALEEEASGRDKGALRRHLDRVRNGVEANRAALTPHAFLREYLYCVGSSQKKYRVRMNESRGPSYWELQLKLFRGGDVERIVRDEQLIRDEWAVGKAYLSPKMVEDTLRTAHLVRSWPQFQQDFLVIPKKPDSENPRDWQPVLKRLMELDGVGRAIAPYLVRNLYGGSFFKPDVHIEAIARHFYGDGPDPVSTMATASKRAWPDSLPSGAHADLHVANLGVIDYFLWFYRQATQIP